MTFGESVKLLQIDEVLLFPILEEKSSRVQQQLNCFIKKKKSTKARNSKGDNFRSDHINMSLQCDMQLKNLLILQIHYWYHYVIPATIMT